ncbi:MAG: DUF975 family protein [Clostridiales bacterium]|nr:DUF975 family protein [Clostridiales bacterium]
MFDRLSLKYRAAKVVSEANPSPVTVTFVYLIITAILDYLQSRLSEPMFFWKYEISFRSFNPQFEKSMFIPILLILALSILLQFISVGYLSYTLRLSRKQPANMNNLGDGFYRYRAIIGIYFLQTIFVLLWSLLLIVPGIIAAYRYRMAYYIALDREDLGPLQCINESKRLMHGSKLELFILDLSFLGWWLLGMMTFGILLIWKLPYIQVTYAYVYQHLLYRHLNPSNGFTPPNM